MEYAFARLVKTSRAAVALRRASNAYIARLRERRTRLADVYVTAADRRCATRTSRGPRAVVRPGGARALREEGGCVPAPSCVPRCQRASEA